MRLIDVSKGRINMYIGIDLGGTGIKAGLVDEKYNIVHSASVPTGAERHYTEIIKDMASLAIRVTEEAGYDIKKDVKSIGIGSPGTCDSKNGILIYANNLNFFQVPMREEMQKYINLPVYIGNDANVAALGEFKALGDDTIEHMIAITLGTGVGGGIIINKKIYEGFNGAGGEIGHFQVQMTDGEDCTCGRRGCWEAYGSVSALIRDTKRAAQAHPESEMAKDIAANGGKVTGKTSFVWAKKGDSVAKEVVENYIKAVAEGIVSVINIFQPEVLVIGGAISKEGDYLLNPIKEIVEKFRYSRSIPQTDIRIAKLGNDAGIIGAALLGE